MSIKSLIEELRGECSLLLNANVQQQEAIEKLKEQVADLSALPNDFVSGAGYRRMKELNAMLLVANRNLTEAIEKRIEQIDEARELAADLLPTTTGKKLARIVGLQVEPVPEECELCGRAFGESKDDHAG